MVLRDIYPIDAGQSPKEEFRPTSPPRSLPPGARSTSGEKRLTLKARLLVWGGVLAAAFLFPNYALAVQQDSSRAPTAKSVATKVGPKALNGDAAKVTAPPAKLPITVEVDRKRDKDQVESASTESPKSGIYFSIGDSQPLESEAPEVEAATDSVAAQTDRRPLIGIPAGYLQRQEDPAFVQQAPRMGDPTKPQAPTTPAVTSDTEDTATAGLNTSTSGLSTPTSGPIVAPVAPIQGFAFQARDGQSRGVQLSKQAESTDRRHEKNFVDPTQYRVQNSGTDEGPQDLSVVRSSSRTNAENEMIAVPRHQLSPATQPSDARATPFTNDLNSIVKHVVNNMPTDRLPPVDMIPSTSNSGAQPFALQTSAEVNPRSAGGSIINKVEFSDSSERRGFQGQDKQQRAPGEPELYSISEITNPLANLDYPTNDSDYGDQVPADESIKRFGAYTKGILVQDTIRTSISYGKPSAWFLMVETWESPAFAYQPLYFEEVNLERYGHYVPHYQPVISAAHFAGSLASLPYQMYVHPPCEPIYTLGHYRPGSCNPHQIHYLPLGR